MTLFSTPVVIIYIIYKYNAKYKPLWLMGNGNANANVNVLSIEAHQFADGSIHQRT